MTDTTAPPSATPRRTLVPIRGMSRVGSWLAACLAVSVVLASILVSYILPRFAATSYTERVTAAARPLKSYYRQLEKTADLPVFGDMGGSYHGQQSDTHQAHAAALDTLDSLAELHRVCSSLPRYTALQVSRDYRQAHVLQQHCASVVEQSLLALHDHELLVVYLDKQLALQHEFSVLTKQFNDTVDLNEYAGRGNELRTTAGQLRAITTQTDALTPPPDVLPVQLTLKDTYRQTAQGFEDLADGIGVALDGPIYSAAAAIEAAVRKNDTQDAAVYSRILDTSKTLKNVRSVNEKLELLQ